MKTLLLELNYHNVSKKTMTKFIQQIDHQAKRLFDGQIQNITSNNHLLESRNKWRNRAFTNLAYATCYERAIETLYNKYKGNSEKISLLDELDKLYCEYEKEVEL